MNMNMALRRAREHDCVVKMDRHISWQAVLSELGLEQVGFMAAAPSFMACMEQAGKDHAIVAAKFRALGIEDNRVLAELANGLAKLAQVDKIHGLRTRSYIAAPLSLDWRDDKTPLGSGDRFLFAFLFAWWVRQTEDTIVRHAGLRPAAAPGLPSAAEFEPSRLVSSNCWGTQYVQKLSIQQGAPYNSPFIGCFMHTPCFLAMLEDWDTYMQAPLEPADGNRSKYSVGDGERSAAPSYPVARWLQAEVHFVHADNAVEAIAAFDRRRRRFLESTLPILVKLDDRDAFEDALAVRFLALKRFKRKLLVVGQRHRHLASNQPSGILVLDDECVRESGSNLRPLPVASLRTLHV